MDKGGTRDYGFAGAFFVKIRWQEAVSVPFEIVPETYAYEMFGVMTPKLRGVREKQAKRYTTFDLRFYMAGALGFEPRLAAPKKSDQKENDFHIIVAHLQS